MHAHLGNTGPAVPIILVSVPAMKIYGLYVLEAPAGGNAKVLASAQDLSSFSFYTRSTVGEYMSFFSRTIAERTPQGQRQTAQENNYTFHVYNRGGSEQLACKLFVTSVRSVNDIVASQL